MTTKPNSDILFFLERVNETRVYRTVAPLVNGVANHPWFPHNGGWSLEAYAKVTVAQEFFDRFKVTAERYCEDLHLLSREKNALPAGATALHEEWKVRETALKKEFKEALKEILKEFGFTGA